MSRPSQPKGEISVICAAIDALGGQASVARRLGIWPGAVAKWKSGRIPAIRAVQLELLTEGRFRREQLLPAVFEHILTKDVEKGTKNERLHSCLPGRV